MTATALDRAMSRLNALHESRPDVVRLAQAASLAVRVEPPLLRQLRLQCVPTADVGSEADLWFSRLVESRGADAIVLESNVVQVLREHLANDPPLFDRVRQVTAATHRNAPAAIRLEEAINAVALMNRERAAATIDRLLRPAVRALRENDQRALEIARWWMRAAPRLHARVWQTDNALALLIGAAARLGRPLEGHLAALPAQSLDRLAWALPALARTQKIAVGVELEERHVRFVEPTDAHPTIQVPATSPAIVEVSWRIGSETRRAVSEAAAGLSVDLDDGARDVTLRTLGGAVYGIRQEATTMAAKTCYVVMGFGKKTDFETGRTLDLDRTYRNIIKPAVIAAGLECVRADEIPHSGVIDVPMYERLLTADVVIADLSTSNKNAFYELGVRHALRPRVTIVICEDGAKSYPFDVNHVPVRLYHHMGEGIDFDEVERFRRTLTEAIVDKSGQDPPEVDSPVYSFLHDLTPPTLAGSMGKPVSDVAPAVPVVKGAQAGDQTYTELMREVDEAQSEGDFRTAKALLSRLRRKMGEAAGKAAADARERGQLNVAPRPEDPYVIQRLALATYKSKLPSPKAALEEARELLAILEPHTSNDTETLGLWGTVHKRLWEETGEVAHLEMAVRGYERGFHLRNDYYNGINVAYLQNVRAAESAKRSDAAASRDEVVSLRADAIASYVNAAATRREVLQICESVLGSEKLTDESKYWVLATMAEAYLGMGDQASADRVLGDAFTIASAQWMKDSTQDQMNKLRGLLASSPLRFIRAD